jgi:outer membrane protein TolC
VGETILVENTLFQNSLSLSASINLYDFGTRENRILIAEKDVPLKQALLVQSVRDTKIRVVEIYRDLLILVNDFASNKQLLTLYKELSLTKERLYDAGLISRLEVSDEAIRVVKIIDQMDRLLLKISGTLKDLAYLTGESYAAEGLELAHFKEEEQESSSFNLSGSPEYRIYEMALQKKKTELDILKKEMYLPRFGIYSNYIFYGQDPNSYAVSWGDVRARSFNIGLVASVAIFDGFKNNAQIERVRIEIERLKVERDKKLFELVNRHEKLKEESRMLRKTLSNQQELMTRTEEGLSMLSRLAERRIVEHVEFLKRNIEQVMQRQEQVRASILKSAAIKELQILSEG